MADYGHDLLFGTFLTPSVADADRIVMLARLSEQAGLDLVSVQDHPYQPALLDAWTLLAVIAASTTRIRVFPNVANLPLRPPAVLARSVASLDRLTGGRIELGLGAGAFNAAVVANGGPRRDAGESVVALEEAIAVIRAIWAGDRPVRVDGTHYRIAGAKPGPVPAHDVGIWLGAYKPRMLRVTGRLADGWLPSLGYAGLDALPAMNQIIDDAAEAAARPAEAIRRLYNINGAFGRGGGFLRGSPPEWAEQLTDLTMSAGISGYILASDDPTDIQRFGDEVAPAVRELVAAARGRDAVAAAMAGAVDLVGSGTADRDVAGADAGDARGAGDAGDAGAAGGLGVAPTPDDGFRRGGVRLWDESARPAGPGPRAGYRYTAGQRAAGQHLIDVHDHLRQELAQIHDLVDRVAAGHIDIGAARSQINEMTVRQNNWTLGTYCESYCRVVTTHHTIEDVSVFPHLRRMEPDLVPVIDRLEEEHLVIHGAIDGVDRALVGLVGGGTITALRSAVDLLSDTLRSHLSYEERELVEPLARHGFQ